LALLLALARLLALTLLLTRLLALLGTALSFLTGLLLAGLSWLSLLRTRQAFHAAAHTLELR
jgi:hypothetical protein